MTKNQQILLVILVIGIVIIYGSVLLMLNSQAGTTFAPTSRQDTSATVTAIIASLPTPFTTLDLITLSQNSASFEGKQIECFGTVLNVIDTGSESFYEIDAFIDGTETRTVRLLVHYPYSRVGISAGDYVHIIGKVINDKSAIPSFYKNSKIPLITATNVSFT